MSKPLIGLEPEKKSTIKGVDPLSEKLEARGHNEAEERYKINLKKEITAAIEDRKGESLDAFTKAFIKNNPIERIYRMNPLGMHGEFGIINLMLMEPLQVYMALTSWGPRTRYAVHNEIKKFNRLGMQERLSLPTYHFWTQISEIHEAEKAKRNLIKRQRLEALELQLRRLLNRPRRRQPVPRTPIDFFKVWKASGLDPGKRPKTFEEYMNEMSMKQSIEFELADLLPSENCLHGIEIRRKQVRQYAAKRYSKGGKMSKTLNIIEQYGETEIVNNANENGIAAKMGLLNVKDLIQVMQADAAATQIGDAIFFDDTFSDTMLDNNFDGKKRKKKKGKKKNKKEKEKKSSEDNNSKKKNVVGGDIVTEESTDSTLEKKRKRQERKELKILRQRQEMGQENKDCGYAFYKIGQHWKVRKRQLYLWYKRKTFREPRIWNDEDTAASHGTISSGTASDLYNTTFTFFPWKLFNFTPPGLIMAELSESSDPKNKNKNKLLLGEKSSTDTKDTLPTFLKERERELAILRGDDKTIAADNMNNSTLFAASTVPITQEDNLTNFFFDQSTILPDGQHDYDETATEDIKTAAGTITVGNINTNSTFITDNNNYDTNNTNNNNNRLMTTTVMTEQQTNGNDNGDGDTGSNASDAITITSSVEGMLKTHSKLSKKYVTDVIDQGKKKDEQELTITNEADLLKKEEVPQKGSKGFMKKKKRKVLQHQKNSENKKIMNDNFDYSRLYWNTGVIARYKRRFKRQYNKAKKVADKGKHQVAKILGLDGKKRVPISRISIVTGTHAANTHYGIRHRRFYWFLRPINSIKIWFMIAEFHTRREDNLRKATYTRRMNKFYKHKTAFFDLLEDIGNLIGVGDYFESIGEFFEEALSYFEVEEKISDGVNMLGSPGQIFFGYCDALINYIKNQVYPDFDEEKFLLACECGDIRAVKTMVKWRPVYRNRIGLNATDAAGRTGVMIAFIKCLKIDAKDPTICKIRKGDRAKLLSRPRLHKRSEKYMKIVKYLLRRGANINFIEQAPDIDAKAIIHYAVLYRNRQRIKDLIKLGCNLNIQTTKTKRTPLILAARRGWEDVMFDLYQDREADLDIRDVDGRTALHHAARVNARKCCECLVILGANKTLINFDNKHTATEESRRMGMTRVYEAISKIDLSGIEWRCRPVLDWLYEYHQLLTEGKFDEPENLEETADVKRVNTMRNMNNFWNNDAGKTAAKMGIRF